MMKAQHVSIPELSMGILKKMNTLRHNRMFYDVVLEIDKLVIYSHKAVLSACSQYFFSMFQKDEEQNLTDLQKSHYPIDFLSKKEFYLLENLIDFIYTSSLQVSPVDIPIMYDLSSKLKIQEISEHCAKYLAQNVTLGTCISTRKLATLYNDTELMQNLDKFITDNFSEVISQPEYLALPRMNVNVSVYSPETASNDSLTPDERARFKIKVIDWILRSHSPDISPLKNDRNGDDPVPNPLLSSQATTDAHFGKKGIYVHLDRKTGKLNRCPLSIVTSEKPVPPKRISPPPNRPSKHAELNGFETSAPSPSLATNGNVEGEDASDLSWSFIAYVESENEKNDIVTALVSLRNRSLISFRIKFYPTSIHTTDTAGAYPKVPHPPGTNWTTTVPMQNLSAIDTGDDNVATVSRFNGIDTLPCRCHDPHSAADYLPVDDHVSTPTTNGYHTQNSHVTNDAADHYPMKVGSNGTTLPTGLDDKISKSNLSQSRVPSPVKRKVGLIAPMRSPRCGMGAVELSGKMLVCGGYDRGECLDSSEIYDPRTNTWSPFKNMLGPRGRMDMAVLDGKVYVMGGSNGSTELNSAECFDLETQSWNTIPSPMPQHCSNVGLAVLNKKIYCIGGQCGQTILKDVFVFDIETKVWSPVRPLNTARYQACVASLDQKLYVVGGSNNWNCLNSVEVYDVNTERWIYGVPIQIPRRGAGIAMYRGKLYSIGGTDGTKVLSSVEIYDPVTDTWVFGSKLNVPRVNVKLVVVGDILYAVGGFSGKSFLNSIEYLNNDQNEWTMVISPPPSLLSNDIPTPFFMQEKLNSSSHQNNIPIAHSNGISSIGIPKNTTLVNGVNDFNYHHINNIPGESIFLLHQHSTDGP